MIEHAIEDERKVSQLEIYAATAAEYGHEPTGVDHLVSVLAAVVENDADFERCSKNLTWWGEEFVRASQLFDPEWKQKLANYELIHRRQEQAALAGEWTSSQRSDKVLRMNPIGSVEECVARLQHIVDMTGVRHLVCGFEVIGPDRERVLRSMRRFAREVIPRIRPAAH